MPTASFRSSRRLTLFRAKAVAPPCAIMSGDDDSPNDPRSSLEKVFNRTTWLSPEDIRSIMLKTTRSVYDVEFDSHKLSILPCTSAPEKETLQYMKKLREICDTVQKMGATDIVKRALEGLDGPVTEVIEIDLGVKSRMSEFVVEDRHDPSQN